VSGPSERLGETGVPSGVLLVVDTGLLPIWSGRRPPLLPAGLLASREATEDANRGVDFRIEGPDAERAARALGRGDARFVFDVPAGAVAATREAFARIAAEGGLDARLVPLPARLPHRLRADLAVGGGGGAGEVFFHGATAVAVEVPAGGRPAEIRARRAAPGPDAGRWREVWAEWSAAPVSSSALAGHVIVAQARLMFADADALDAWVPDEALDGNADFVFWGHDAALAAVRTDAPDLGHGDHGWRDVPVEEALARGAEVEGLAERSGYAIAWDYRPHSHHWEVLEQVRTSPTESGTVEVGGARMCTLMTGGENGRFPVYRDLGPDGALLRVRVVLERAEAGPRG
jgi:hypothetical protein